MSEFYKRKYAEVLDEKTNVDALNTKLRKDNANLRKIIIRFEMDCKRLQESLDECERDIMEMKGL